jgi:integrase
VTRSRTRSTIYWRNRGGEGRAYGDFRDYADVGGGREALILPGQKVATTDPVVAEKLAVDRLMLLEERRRSRALLGVERQVGLAEFAEYHLVQKARTGQFTEQWLAAVEMHLRTAVDFLGAERDPASIRVAEIQKYAGYVQRLPNGRGGTLSGGSVRKYLNSLSNLYRRAVAESVVPPGYNPVAALIEKPTAGRREARWLEVHEAALLLESARTHRPERPEMAQPHLYPIVATFLLTGGRESEVLGLEVEDVSFDRKVIAFRPNRWRRLKTSTSHRSVPVWPQLDEILRKYVFGGNGPLGSLLFPSVRGPHESMITDLRKALDAIAVRAGWKAGEIRTKMFRHTYCAARLQTLDRGAPVSEYTVARELGHGGRAMVERVYGHLGRIRHRSKVVEYRSEQHEEVLGERLAALRARVDAG